MFKKSVAVLSALLLTLVGLIAMPTSANAAAIVLDMSGKSIKFNQATSPTPVLYTTTTSNDTTLYKNVATVSGITIDAVIVRTLVNAGSFTLDSASSAVSAPPAGTLTPPNLTAAELLQTDVSATSSGGYVSLNFKFYEAGTYTGSGTGNQVTLRNLTVNTYDLDNVGGHQFTMFNGFQTYTLSASSATTVAVSSVTGGWVKFTDTSNTNYGDTTGSYTKGRALVTYDQLTELSIRHGVDANAGGKFALDFGPGYAWKDSTTSTTTTSNNPNNSPPTSAAASVYYPVNSAYVFHQNVVPTTAIAAPNNQFDFPYQDPENNAFATLKIVSLPGAGNLQTLIGSTWTNVTVGQAISATSIANGLMRFNGTTGVQTFTFKVNDGQADSASTYTFTLNPATGPQTITFANPGTKQVNATPFASNATASSGLTVTLISLTPSTCTVTGLNITAIANGTCTIIAIQNGNSTYSNAAPVTQSFSISPLLNQVITLNNPGTQTVNTNIGTAPTTTGVGLTVALASLTTDVCTVSGFTVYHIAEGNCTLYATQAGNGTYAPAAPVQVTYLVNAGALNVQAITFAAPSNISRTTTTVNLTATATSGLTVTFGSNTPSVCTVTSSGVVTILGSGACSITAYQPGNVSWAAATVVTRIFYILEVTTASLPSGVAGTAYSSTLSAFQGATGTYVWTNSAGCLTSSGLSLDANTGVISGATPVAGTYVCTYTATDSGVSASKSLTIVIAASAPPTKTTNTITWTQLPDVSITNGNITLAATSTGTAASPPTVIYYTSNTSTVCTVAGNIVTILDTGYCELTADDDGNATYAAASQATNSFNIFAICTPSISSGFQDQPYSQTFALLGNVGVGTWSLTGGLPSGLTFSAGVLSGNPSVPWNGNITVTYTQGGSTHSRVYSLIINAPAGGGGGGGAPAPTPTPTPTPGTPSATPTPTPTPTPSAPATVELKAIAFFAGDSTKMVGTSSTVIKNLASNIKAEQPSSVSIVVAGYVNKTGDTSYDTKLALARAQATAKLLASQGVVATVTVESKGIHPTSGASARRTEVTVTIKK